MKNRIIYAIVLILTAFLRVAQAATITVNTADNTDFGAGKTNLVRAIQLLADGDTINFNIPNTTTNKHYIVTPPRDPDNGYPPITNNNVTIDGYSQPGASPNTNPILAANNAQIRIVLDSTGDAGTVQDINGYGLKEAATLFVTGVTNAAGTYVGGTNVHIKGLCFLGPGPTVGGGTSGTIGDPSRYAISFGPGADYGHVSGCRIGLDLDGTTLHRFKDAVTVFGDTGIAPSRTSIGVKPGPADAAGARAQFNIIIGQFISLIFEGGTNYNISGNFINVYPDGLTDFTINGIDPHNAESFIEFGGSLNTVVGTDGDGLNDAEERNIFGGVTFANDRNLLEFYGGGTVNLKIAGNYFGISVDGLTQFTNSTTIVDNFKSGATAQFGSDLDGVSDAIEGNVIYMNNPFPDPSTAVLPSFSEYDKGARVSLRGNKMVNNNLAPYSYADGFGGRLNNFTNYATPFMDPATNSIIPTLDPTSIYPRLKGTFALGTNGFTNIIIDVYQLDLEGWQNGKAVAGAQNWSELTDSASYTNGFAQGSKYLGSRVVPNTGSFNIDITGMAPGERGQFTVTANYSADPPGTHNGRVHTSDFSMPVYTLPGDVACWYHATGNYVTNGLIDLANQASPATLGNWEPYIGAIGDSTFLIEFNTYANDGSLTHQNNAVAKQPAAGGPAKVDYCFYGDNGLRFKGILNYRRQNGNPGRVAGDLRYGANKFITEAEVSIGQDPAFQSVARWGNNNIYSGTAIFPENGNQGAAGNAYPAEQIFTLDPVTLTQTPVTNAWDYTYGNYVGVMGAGNNAPQVGRTGGRPNFLDNGNIVVMTDDKAAIVSTAGEVTTFSIIQPDGTIVKSATLAKAQDIFDNMCAVKGGFVIRVHNSLLFYNNSGTLTFSNDVNVSSSMNFAGGADVGGRGDGIRIGGDIRSYYVYVAGTINGGGGSPEVGVGAWDTRTGQFVGGSVVTDGDPAVEQSDRTSVAVDALNRVCVTWMYKPDRSVFGYQAAARVAQFDGSNFNWLTHSFFPFLNHDQDPANVLGYLTLNPVVAMNTRQICIAAKGTINNVNNVSAGPNSLAEQTVYTVFSHPVPVAAPSPIVTITKSGDNLNLSWNPDDGLFTVQTRSSVTSSSWANATAGNVAPPVSIPAGAGQLYIRLAR